jgi:hypothetical protein
MALAAIRQHRPAPPLVTLTHAISSGDAYTLPSLMPAEFDPAHAPSILEIDELNSAKNHRV